MPIVAVAAGAYAATTVATVGIAAMSTFGVIAAVGAITSGIGALTGNDTLMRVGGVAALAGGVGAFAQGQGWLATGDAMNTVGAEATGTSTTKALAQSAAPGVQSPSPAAAMGNAGELATTGLEQGSIAGNLTSANQLARPGLIDTVGSTADAGIIGSPLTAGPGAASAPLPMEAGGFAKSLGMTELGAGAAKMGFDPTMGARGGIFDTLKGFGKFMDENKTLSSIGANFIGGMFDEEKEAKANYYKAGTDALRAKTANASAVPNMNFKLKPGSIWKPTSPTYNAPRPSGLFYAK